MQERITQADKTARAALTVLVRCPAPADMLAAMETARADMETARAARNNAAALAVSGYRASQSDVLARLAETARAADTHGDTTHARISAARAAALAAARAAAAARSAAVSRRENAAHAEHMAKQAAARAAYRADRAVALAQRTTPNMLPAARADVAAIRADAIRAAVDASRAACAAHMTDHAADRAVRIAAMETARAARAAAMPMGQPVTPVRTDYIRPTAADMETAHIIGCAALARPVCVCVDAPAVNARAAAAIAARIKRSDN